MSSRSQALVVGLHALLGIAVLVSATVVEMTGNKIDAEMGVLYGAIIGLAGGGAAAISTLGTAVNGKAALPPQLISDMLENQRQTIAHLAHARTTVDAATQAGGRRIVDPPAAEPAL